MSGSTKCWWCMGKLVGPGGVKGKEPLFFKEVDIGGGCKVRVHVACEADTLKNLKTVTARPKDDDAPKTAFDPA